MASQSILTKNGQQLKVSGGAGAIAVADTVLIGGPGNEAWSAGTTDYASIPAAGTLLAPASMVSARIPGSSRQPIARDRVGNIYIIGTNSSGNVVAYKFNPQGTLVSSAVLDATATSVNTPILFQLQSGAYCCVYARASGALCFLIFDSNLNLVAGPSSIVTEYATGNVVYHSACAISGGGFAIVYQTSAGTSLAFATYTNTGSSTVTPTNIFGFGGSVAQMSFRVAQLSSGNLAIAYRGTMTVSASAGTGFVILTTGGTIVAGPTNLDSTSSAGLLELNVLTGFFAIAAANGANLIATVLNNAGAIQGSPYSVGTTLNATTYPQIKLCNDGSKFWLTWFSSVANGIYTIGLATSGVSGPSASALGGSTLSASTFALDVEVINGLLVFIAASTVLLGQFYGSIGLPDTSLGVVQPYIRTPPTALGSAAATTGSLWPRVISSSAGLYQGTSPPPSQPTVSPTDGDFTAIFVFDQQNSPQTFISIQKLEASAIVGIALASLVAGVPGTGLLINPGPGEYTSNNIAGTSGLGFNHLGLKPGGTAGTLFSTGIALAGMTAGPFAQTSNSLNGQCLLQYSSISLIVLNPYNGNLLKIAGVSQTIPSAGVNGSVPAGVSTAYYVYAYMNAAGVMALEFSVTGYVVDTSVVNGGVVIKNGDSSRTLVGYVYVNGSDQFTSFLVRSWFNRVAEKVNQTQFTTTRTSTSATIAEVNAEIRNTVLVWAGETVGWSLNGGMYDTGGATGVIAGIAFDGIIPESAMGITSTNGAFIGLADSKTSLSEGLHYATVVGGASSGNTLTFTGPPYTLGGGVSAPATLSLRVMG